jgi:secreted PhoX family phosphatase
MNRDEHLKWCKQRALNYLNDGDLRGAFTSMLSDMEKHEETKGINAALLALGTMYVQQYDIDGMRRWIEGFR